MYTYSYNSTSPSRDIVIFQESESSAGKAVRTSNLAKKIGNLLVEYFPWNSSSPRVFTLKRVSFVGSILSS
jgi:hypothetical protein